VTHCQVSVKLKRIVGSNLAEWVTLDHKTGANLPVSMMNKVNQVMNWLHPEVASEGLLGKTESQVRAMIHLVWLPINI
jgi:hypothetical protein